MTGPAHCLHLCLTDRMSVTADGRALDPGGRPARWLLGYLALSQDYRAARTAMASQFWEDRPDTRARQNLRQALLALRKGLGPDFADVVRSGREDIWLDRDRVATDIADLTAKLDRGEIDSRLLSDAVPDRVLSDLEPAGNLLASWLHLRRMDIDSRLRDGLNVILSTAEDDMVLRAARALLVLDPSDENACRTLMQTAWKAGAPARALEVYAQLWDYLDDEYGIEPAPETQALVARIKLQDDRPPQQSATPSSPPQRPRILVRPLEIAGASQTDAPMLELFRTELISRLIRFREWQLFDGAHQSHESDYDLRLSGITSGGQISLVVVLTNIGNGQIVWGDSSQASAEDWPDFHIRIARRLAASLNINLSVLRLARLAARPAENAVDNWLLGQTRMQRFRKEDLEAAMRLFETASRQDPHFARAWSSQSQILNIRHLCLPGTLRNRETINRSLMIANRAVSIDPTDAQAHLCRGWANMHLREWTQAKVSFDLAERCNPDEPWVVISAALAAAFRGEHVRSLLLSKRFLSEGWTNSAINWGYLSNIHFLARDFERSVAAAENAGAASLNIPAWHAAALAHLGRLDAAAGQWRVFEDLARSHWSVAATPTRALIRDWLLSGFPIRRAKDHAALACGVDLAIAQNDLL